jgi:hypothetical protein
MKMGRFAAEFIILGKESDDGTLTIMRADIPRSCSRRSGLNSTPADPRPFLDSIQHVGLTKVIASNWRGGCALLGVVTMLRVIWAWKNA